MDNTPLLFIAVLLFVFFFLSKREALENIKDVKNFVLCKDCKTWNHRDARSKCEKQCKLKFADQNPEFTGKWTRLEGSDISCECAFAGKFKKEYVGCPVGSKLDKRSCFIWNDKDAKSVCPTMCNKFLTDVQPTWTGNWKSTSVDSSACECEYYG
mgnify:CR=1 FL=1|jgi:hypothetical protein